MIPDIAQKKKKGSGSWRQDRKNQRENTQSKEEGAVEKDICIVPPTIQFLMSETTGHKLKNWVWYALLWHPVSWTPFWPGVKNLRADAGGTGDSHSVPGSGRSPGGGHSNVLQYSCLENPHGQRNLGGYGPRGLKELDTTEATYYIVHTHVLFIFKISSS